MKKKKLIKILKTVSKIRKECNKFIECDSHCPFYYKDKNHSVYCLAQAGFGAYSNLDDARLKRIKELEEELNVSNKQTRDEES